MDDARLSVLESVGLIIEERDKRILEKIFINSVAQFVNFDALILLHKPSHADNPYLEVTMSMPEGAYKGKDKLKMITHANGAVHIHMDDAIKKCINTSQTLFLKVSDGDRAVIPIITHHEVVGVIDLYADELIDTHKKMVMGFMHIYQNFIEVLYDNEHDTLTGLLNRKTFDDRLKGFYPEAQQNINPEYTLENDNRQPNLERNHWVGILDIDHFKSVNDQFGHIFGDEVLLLFAGIMKQEFRNTDLLFRFGGEEFVIFLLNISEQEAFNKFDHFRRSLEQFAFPQIDTLTVSIGITKIDTQFHSTKLLEQADRALYYAKEHGRNQVHNYHHLIETGELTTLQIDNKIDLF